MSEQTNINPKKKPVAADELSEEALDQVAGGPASQPSTTVKYFVPLQGANTTAMKTAVPGGTVTGQIGSSPKG